MNGNTQDESLTTKAEFLNTMTVQSSDVQSHQACYKQ